MVSRRNLKKCLPGTSDALTRPGAPTINAAHSESLLSASQASDACRPFGFEAIDVREEHPMLATEAINASRSIQVV